MRDFPCKINYISRVRTAVQVKATLKELEKGGANVLIDTYRIVGRDIRFKDLDLLIIDGEQKLRISVKKKLR